MSDEQQQLNEFAIIDGGVKIAAVKIDGSREEVKVRQLPIRFIEEWGRTGDQSHLVELLCDKIDRSTLWHIRNAHAVEQRLLEIIKTATIDQVAEVHEKLRKVREEISALESKPHWSDDLEQDSFVEILELGDKLNRPRLARWALTQGQTIGQKMKTLMESLSQNSSAPSQPSAGSTNQT